MGKSILVSTPSTSLVLSAPENGEVRIIYYGDKITSDQISQIYDAGLALDRPAYPVFGIECMSEAALQVQHADGNLSLDMVVTNVTTEATADANLTKITMKDKLYPFEIKLVYKAYTQSDVIETWSEISHQEKKPVVLQQFASGYLPIRKGDVWISHLHGTWANEGKVTTEPLLPGMKVIKNKDGVRNSHTDHAEVMISLDGKPQENQGRVIGAALCWGGNFRLRFDTTDDNFHYFFAGINEDASEGLQPDGGMIYETNPATRHTDADRHWWVQAETVVEYCNLYQHFGDEGALVRAVACWEFIRKHLIDREGGEWFWSLRADGSVNRDDDKAGFWKCPYHNGRMCMEIMERF